MNLQRIFVATTVTVMLTIVACLSNCKAQNDLQVETVIDGLRHPFGVAIRGDTEQIFVSESGAGRVVRVENGKAVPVVTGFPQSAFPWASEINSGPLGICFVSKDLLAVGWGGNADGPQQIQMYELAGDETGYDAAQQPNGQTLTTEDGASSLSVFYGVVSTPRGLYFSTQGDEGKGWIARSTIADNRLSDANRFIATEPAVNFPNPAGMTISPDGFIVVSQMGKAEEEADSQISFYDEATGELKANFSTGLMDMVGIAYGPNAGRLFAVDVSWNDDTKCGLYKLIGRENFTKCVHEKIIELQHPTSLAFAKDGSLYVTVLGNDLSGDSMSGKLLKISGLDIKKETEQESETDSKDDGQ